VREGDGGERGGELVAGVLEGTVMVCGGACQAERVIGDAWRTRKQSENRKKSVKVIKR
jgi:hypothetical protein